MEPKFHKFRVFAWLIAGLVIATLALVAFSPAATAEPYPPPPEVDGFEVAGPVQLLLPDRAALEYLVANGFDLDHSITETDSGVVVTVILMPSELAFLETLGFTQVTGGAEQAAAGAPMAQSSAALSAPADTPGLLSSHTDTVLVLRADYWKSDLAEALSIEAKTSAGTGASLTAYWEPAPLFGITCSAAMGMGNVPANETFKYSLRFVNPATSTDSVYEGFVTGAAEFNPVVSWPDPPEEGVASYSWHIWVNNGTELGSGEGTFDCDAPLPTLPPAGSRSLQTFTDVGVYIYHYRQQSTSGRPGYLTVVSSEGGSDTAFFSEWVPDGNFPNYSSGYVSGYMDPTQLYERIEALAAEFPELAEIIDAPYLTNGYRRQALGLLGSTSSTRVALTSHAWGHEGGNGINVSAVDPGATDSPLSVSVSGTDITISLATDAAGATVSTAAEVIAAINSDPAASALVYADPYRGNSASGVVAPQSITMSDYLSAPPEVSREPYQVRVLRIGKHRDGSRIGVFFYAQEHAREWVPPLVTIETAERLLRNYYVNGASKVLLDNLDIFILPSVNPDGGHYSFYDFNSQRKNMTNHCARGADNDLNRRNSWGVDVNRNYAVGSLFDGYFGADDSCTSGTFSGPAELSEPESKNVVWVADTYPNIKFSMNIHSSGNYFMWSPAAYIVPGRISLPRPSFGEENYFYYASARILQAIREHRGLVVTPARTGPVIDVLYSAAGNSGDHLYYANDIYAWDFEVGTSFQPSWPEAYEQSQEFSNGLIEMLELALDLDRDSTRPTAWLTNAADAMFGRKPFTGLAEIKFATSEPAAVYYTLDGSTPTMASAVYNSSGIREPGEILRFTTTTTVRWFAVDAAGNSSSVYTQQVVVR